MDSNIGPIEITNSGTFGISSVTAASIPLQILPIPSGAGFPSNIKTITDVYNVYGQTSEVITEYRLNVTGPIPPGCETDVLKAMFMFVDRDVLEETIPISNNNNNFTNIGVSYSAPKNMDIRPLCDLEVNPNANKTGCVCTSEYGQKTLNYVLKAIITVSPRSLQVSSGITNIGPVGGIGSEPTTGGIDNTDGKPNPWPDLGNDKPKGSSGLPWWIFLIIILITLIIIAVLVYFFFFRKPKTAPTYSPPSSIDFF